MAFSTINTLSEGTGVRFDPFGGDSGIVLENAQLISTDSTAVLLNDGEVISIYGMVYGADTGVVANTTDAGTLFIAAGGRVGGTLNGVKFEIGFNSASITSLINNGEIVGVLDDGVDGQGSNARILNNGSISGTYGIYYSSPSASDVQIVNTGTISATSADGFGISLVVASGGVITNSGTITNGVLAASGENSTFTLTNTGLILASSSGSAYGDATFLLTNHDITNSGTMAGNVTTSDGNDIVTNSGMITGTLDLKGGSDTFYGFDGTITGPVFGGEGDDAYYIDQARADLRETGLGVDTVFADTSFRLATLFEHLTLLGAGNHVGSGNSLANILTGNAGDNRLSGLGGNDTINGDLGNDRMLGGAGNDTMLGGDGDDVLQGGAGNDTARGEDGDDVLNGGTGTDLVAGGEGLDTFVFSALAHTTNVLGTADIISDFVKGEDKLNLSAIDAITTNTTPDNAFTFIGSGAFTNVAGQLRYSQAAGYTNVEMDVDGNGTIDGIVRLFGTITLNANDFVL